jgi:small-conductance mechanosensitive channel
MLRKCLCNMTWIILYILLLLLYINKKVKRMLKVTHHQILHSLFDNTIHIITITVILFLQ